MKSENRFNFVSLLIAIQDIKATKNNQTYTLALTLG